MKALKKEEEKLADKIKSKLDIIILMSVLTILFSPLIYLWSIFDLAFYEYGIGKPYLNNLVVFIFFFSLIILYTLRVKTNLNDEKTKNNLNKIFYLILIYIPIISITGGRITIGTLILLGLIFYIKKDYSKYINTIPSKNIKSYQYKLKSWMIILISLLGVCTYILALGIDITTYPHDIKKQIENTTEFPYKTSEEEKLLSLETGYNSVIYNFEITSQETYDIKKLSEIYTEIHKDQICTNEKFFLDYFISNIYNYEIVNQNEEISIQVSTSDCSS
jgi:hypothetical protein